MAAESVSFCLSEARLGLIPATISAYASADEIVKARIANSPHAVREVAWQR